MLWMTHVLIGLFFYLVLSRFGVLPVSLLGVLFVSLGSVLPDIDHPRSFVSHLSAFFRFGSKLIHLGGHRGPMHTIWAVLFLTSLVIAITRRLPISALVASSAFALGYVAHLIADSFTRSGVAWFYPVDRHRISGPIRTGGFIEVGLFFVMSAMVLVLVH